MAFCNRVPFYGLNVLCLDNPNVQSLLPRLEKRFVTYGSSHMADYRLEGVRLEGFTTRFEAFRRDEPLGEFRVRMVGAHNALNALAVIAVAEEMDIPLDVVRGALAEFGGVQRRFTVRGEAAGVTVVDDYGHHPTEVQATLAGARRAFGKRLVVAFQPHRYTRTHDLLKEFATSFNDADVRLRHQRLRGRRGAHPRRHRRGAGRGHPRPRPPRRHLRGEARGRREDAAAPAARGRPRPDPGRRRHHPGGAGAARAAQAARNGEGRVTAWWRVLSSSLPERVGRLSGCDVTANAPLAPLTSVRVGGPAEALVRPRSPEALVALLRFLREEGVPLTVLGGGANTLVGDGGDSGRHREAAGGPVPRAGRRGRGGGEAHPRRGRGHRPAAATRCAPTAWWVPSSSRASPAPWAAR